MAYAFLFPLLIGYAFGSAPFGLILTRLAGLGDVRNIGSGNIGATNVLRTGRKGLAAATLLADGLKGVVAILLTVQWFNSWEPAPFVALGAFVGHLFPVWLKFRGGKGIAVYIGTLCAISWLAAASFALIWLVVAFATRYSSLAALLATLVAPVALWLDNTSSAPIDGQMAGLVFAVMTTLAWIMHRANISRLIQGTESKIGAKE